jgi:hypothetical protein
MSDIVGTTIPTVAAFNALALLASNLPGLNTPVPIYAIVRSDTFIPLTLPSSWGEFSRRYDVALSDYPQEQGAFAVYNKVLRPREINVELVKTGSDIARYAWLAAIEQQEANNPLQLYTLISPQGVYTDYTIAGMANATRRDKGQNLLYLNIKFQEIPQLPTQTGSYQNVAEAKSGPVQQLGRVYTSVSTTAQSALINAQNFLTSAL